MKFLVSFILIILLSLVAGLYMPWWTVSIAAFLAGVLIPQKPWRSFLAGFLALFLLWSFLAYSISIDNDHLLAQKMSFTILKSQSPVALVILTALIGALVAGFAALAGCFLRKSIIHDKIAVADNARG